MWFLSLTLLFRFPPVTADANAQDPGPATVRIEIAGYTTIEKKLPELQSDAVTWHTAVIKALEGPAKELRKQLEDLKSRQDDKATPTRTSRARRLTLSLSRVSTGEAMERIARDAGIRILYPERLPGPITIRCRNAPADQLISLVARSFQFVALLEGDRMVRVIHPDDLLKEMETRVYRLRSKGEERDFLRKIVGTIVSRQADRSPVGKIDYDRATNCLIVRDTAQVLDRIARVIRVLEAGDGDAGSEALRELLRLREEAEREEFRKRRAATP